MTAWEEAAMTGAGLVLFFLGEGVGEGEIDAKMGGDGGLVLFDLAGGGVAVPEGDYEYEYEYEHEEDSVKSGSIPSCFAVFFMLFQFRICDFGFCHEIFSFGFW